MAINNFTDLEAWKVGHDFVLDVYRATKTFPKHETYGISNQLRRSAVSITSNIAEGFSRYSFRDRVRFYYNARGSISESQNHILISKDVGYLDDKTSEALLQKVDKTRRILNGLIRHNSTKF